MNACARLLVSILLVASASLAAASAARATTDIFTGQPDSPLAVDFAGGTATFSGGQVLWRTNILLPVDGTGVYATTSQLAGYANPLTITFSQPVSNVSILILNLAAGTAHIYTNGLQVAFNTLGTKKVTTAGPLTTLTVEGHNYVNDGPDLEDWDFAILSVTTDQGVVPLDATPDPAPTGFTLTPIADSNTPIPGGSGSFLNPTGFGQPTAISGDTVLFQGTGDASQTGIYLGSGGELSTIADINTPIPGGTGSFTSFGIGAAISGTTVVFPGNGTGGQHGIYVGTSGSLSVVADTSTAIPDGMGSFVSFGTRATLSGATVAFIGAGSDGQVGVYTATGGSIAKVADKSTAIPDGAGSFSGFGVPTVSDGTVVFAGQGSDAQGGVYVAAGGSIVKVADKGTPIPEGTGTFTGFGSNTGTVSGSRVVFQGGGDAQSGIYLYSAGSLTKIADKSTAIPDGAGTFTSLSATPAISGSTVLFVGGGIWGQNGIYRFHGGVLSRVIGGNDPVDASQSIFTSILGPLGLDGTRISFAALLGGLGNRRGVFRATRDPECGDGVLEEDAGEECDDDNAADGDGCSSTCLIEVVCGDGQIGDGEECDDGNDADNDGCSSACLVEFCGDGIVQAGGGPPVAPRIAPTIAQPADEECDDGNNTDGDGCSADCRIEDFCTQMCARPEALHVGQSNMALVGTRGPDILCGDERANTLRGNRGDDVLCGFGGDDAINGNQGDDILDGGEGDDVLRGDDGDDALAGGPANDTLYGGAGDDDLSGGPGDDGLRGGSGNDTLDGGDDADKLHGEAGVDECVGEVMLSCENVR